MNSTIKLAESKPTGNRFPKKYGMYYDANEPSCILLIGGDNKSNFIVWDRAFGPVSKGFENAKWIRCPKGTTLTIIEDEDED